MKNHEVDSVAAFRSTKNNQKSTILFGHGLLCKTRPASPLAPKLKDEYHKGVLV